MRVVGLLSWYDEAPSWLAATVASAAKLCDHVVAVDGAYGLYPAGRARSEPMQAETILRTCDALDIGCTIIRPREVWRENEVQKRTHAFAACRPEVTPGEDWIIVLDADDVMVTVPADARMRLELTDLDVAEITLVERETWVGDETPGPGQMLDLPPRTSQVQRRIFRAADEITVVGAHFCYFARTGEKTSWYWGTNDHGLTDAMPLHGIEVEHRSRHRDLNRRQAAQDYYERRNALKIESVGVRLMEGHDGRMVRVA